MQSILAVCSKASILAVILALQLVLSTAFSKAQIAMDDGRFLEAIELRNETYSASEFFHKVEHLRKNDVSPRTGWSPVHYAAYWNYPDALANLGAHGWIMDLPDNNGYTPLSIAIAEGNMEAVEALIEQGAALRIPDVDGQILLDKILTLPLKSELAISKVNNATEDPDYLYYLIRNKKLKLLLPLIDTEYPRIKLNNIPLSLVLAEVDSSYFQKKLYQATIGLHSFTASDEGVTALHVAASLGNEQTVIALINLGAPVLQIDHAGFDAADHAEKNGHVQLAKTIKERHDKKFIKRLQLHLRELGYYKGSLSSEFDIKTKNSLIVAANTTGSYRYYIPQFAMDKINEEPRSGSFVMCNKCNAGEVSFAAAVDGNWPNSNTYVQGWWRLKPNTCHTIWNSEFQKKDIYFYAELPDGTQWSGNGPDVCVSSDSFRHRKFMSCDQDLYTRKVSLIPTRRTEERGQFAQVICPKLKNYIPSRANYVEYHFAALVRSELGRAAYAVYRHKSAYSAEGTALDNCAEDYPDCETVYIAQNQCIAYARDDAGNWGAARAETETEARSDALDACSAYSSDCDIGISVCAGKY